MRALTLHQPWATLVAMGVKSIETRSWGPPAGILGERIAIHAGKGITPPHEAPRVWAPIFETYGSYAVPSGAVVATAQLYDAGEVTRSWTRTCEVRLSDGTDLSVETDIYGDFSTGRYLWLLDDISALGAPIPARGYQGLWRWGQASSLSHMPEGRSAVRLPLGQ